MMTTNSMDIYQNRLKNLEKWENKFVVWLFIWIPIIGIAAWVYHNFITNSFLLAIIPSVLKLMMSIHGWIILIFTIATGSLSLLIIRRLNRREDTYCSIKKFQEDWQKQTDTEPRIKNLEKKVIEFVVDKVNKRNRDLCRKALIRYIDLEQEYTTNKIYDEYLSEEFEELVRSTFFNWVEDYENKIKTLRN